MCRGRRPHSATPTYTVRRDGPAREPSWSALAGFFAKGKRIGIEFGADSLYNKHKIWCRWCRDSQHLQDITHREVSQKVCRCRPGYSGALTYDATCTECPAGTYTSSTAESCTRV